MLSNSCQDDNLTSKQFYSSIDKFHKKVKKLNEVIVEYFRKKNKTYDKEFFALHFIDGSIHDMFETIIHEVDNLPLFKEVFEFWFENKDESEFVQNIYKIEIEDKVFLFQYFCFKEKDEGVVAGYFIRNSFDVRLLLLNLSNSYINYNIKTVTNLLAVP